MNDPTHVPIIIGFTSPFRLVLREEDTWNPTDLEIANRSYDYVKLHRLSTFLDIGIRPYSLAIGFDGSFILPATAAFCDRGEASNKLNEVLGILLLGGIYSESVSAEDVVFGRLTLDGYFTVSTSGSGAIAKFHFAAHSTYLGPLDMVKLVSPLTVKAADFTTAFNVGKSIFAHLPQLSSSILLNGVTHYARHQWAEALILLWTSVEQVLDHIWTAKIIRHNAIEISGRKDFLEDHRSWPTSTRVEMFFQRLLIGSEEYVLINKARKARNDFVHKGIKPSEAAVESSLTVLFRLISFCISEYQDLHGLDRSLEQIEQHKRGAVVPERSIRPLGDVTHWLPKMPIPGDPEWGDRQYDIIADLQLKPIDELLSDANANKSSH